MLTFTQKCFHWIDTVYNIFITFRNIFKLLYLNKSIILKSYCIAFTIIFSDMYNRHFYKKIIEIKNDNS